MPDARIRRVSLRVGRGQCPITLARAIPLEHIARDSLLPLITPHLTPNLGSVEILGVGDRIAVTDLESNIAHVIEVIHELDVLPRQVLIELKIIQLSYNDDHSMGIDRRQNSHRV